MKRMNLSSRLGFTPGEMLLNGPLSDSGTSQGFVTHRMDSWLTILAIKAKEKVVDY